MLPAKERPVDVAATADVSVDAARAEVKPAVVMHIDVVSVDVPPPEKGAARGPAPDDSPDEVPEFFRKFFGPDGTGGGQDLGAG